MCTEQWLGAVRLRIEIKRIVHLPRRVLGRDVQFGEIVIVGFDIGTFRDFEIEIGENRDQLIAYMADGMDASLCNLRRR